jgi:hypothetical protein
MFYAARLSVLLYTQSTTWFNTAETAANRGDFIA